jgi:hypothetical protein
MMVYCRRCRRRHRVREAWNLTVRGSWWFVSCPKRAYYTVPMRHETTGRWMPV